MKTKTIAAVVGLALVAAACTTVPPEELSAWAAYYSSTIPVCRAPKDCEAKWAAARNWMLSECGFRLQHVEADYLETFKSGDYANTDLYCRVTKTPINQTDYRIELVAGANNPLMYSAADKLAIGQRFNDSVNMAWQPVMNRGRVSGPARRSQAGLCYDRGYSSWDGMVGYREFPSFESCIASGGKPSTQ